MHNSMCMHKTCRRYSASSVRTGSTVQMNGCPWKLGRPAGRPTEPLEGLCLLMYVSRCSCRWHLRGGVAWMELAMEASEPGDGEVNLRAARGCWPCPRCSGSHERYVPAPYSIHTLPCKDNLREGLARRFQFPALSPSLHTHFQQQDPDRLSPGAHFSVAPSRRPSRPCEWY